MFRRGSIRRQGSPLLRTAIVGGAAYSMGKSAQRGAYRESAQEQRLAELERQQAMASAPQQGQQPMPPPHQYSGASSASYDAPSAAATPDRLTQLKTLGELRASGVLTDAEFEMEKQKILRTQ